MLIFYDYSSYHSFYFFAWSKPNATPPHEQQSIEKYLKIAKLFFQLAAVSPLCVDVYMFYRMIYWHKKLSTSTIIFSYYVFRRTSCGLQLTRNSVKENFAFTERPLHWWKRVLFPLHKKNSKVHRVTLLKRLKDEKIAFSHHLDFSAVRFESIRESRDVIKSHQRTVRLGALDRRGTGGEGLWWRRSNELRWGGGAEEPTWDSIIKVTGAYLIISW